MIKCKLLEKIASVPDADLLQKLAIPQNQYDYDTINQNEAILRLWEAVFGKKEEVSSGDEPSAEPAKRGRKPKE